MGEVAEIIGYVVIAAAVALALAVCGVLVIRYFPLRFDCILNSPSFLQTPYGKMPVKALVGVSSRGRPAWFIGFMHVGQPDTPSKDKADG